jgi:hypothetical protein
MALSLPKKLWAARKCILTAQQYGKATPIREGTSQGRMSEENTTSLLRHNETGGCRRSGKITVPELSAGNVDHLLRSLHFLLWYQQLGSLSIAIVARPIKTANY